VKGSKYSSIKLTVATGGKKAGLKEISVANEWLTHPHARRYDDTIFEPGNANKAIQNPDGTVFYNLFRGLEGAEGDVEPFFDLLEFLTSRTPELDPDLIWKTLCYKIQNLSGRCDISFMLLGKQGSGKSLFGKICMGMVQPYATKLSMDMVAGNFNGWMEQTLIAVIAETEGAKLRDNIGTIQSWITDKQQNVNEKYRVAKQVDNNTFFMLDSNELSAGFFPDDDRRMVVVHAPDRNPEGDVFYDRIGKWYENGGPKHLLHYFQHYDLEGWTPPNKAPRTRAKHNIHLAGLTPLQKIGERIMDGKTANLVFLWMQAAQTWAATAAGQPNVPHSLLDNVTTSLARLQIRPFYTPDELEILLPALSAGLGQGSRGRFSSAQKLAQELHQQGVPFLDCVDDLRGFRHGGQAQQYLVISDFEEYEDGLTQQEFNKLMRNFPTYAEYNRNKKAAKKPRKSKRKVKG
jgi:ABC-type oligopeptide transport system ATPase subunit